MDQPQPHTKLKLKIGNLPSASMVPGTTTPSRTTTPAGSPPPQTPGGSSTKIKLVRKPTGLTPGATTESTNGAAAPSAMAPPRAPSAVDGAKTTQGPKAPKVKIPKPAKSSPKKRPKPADDDDDDVPLANGTNKEPQKKKPKITLIKTPSSTRPPTKSKPAIPTLKVKPIGKTPARPTGICYDTEAEDKELDPVIEDQIILRMMEGEHLSYLREHVQKKTIGVHKSQGGPDFSLKFLDEQGRRAVLTIQGQLYAAILLDLPTITEGMKSWDKKAMVKSSDICQMMLVFAKVKDEEEAKTAPLPKAVEHGHRWPHGITPPMHDARKRRFRKRLSKLEVQNKEAEVERLLGLDREAVSTKFEFIDDQPALPTTEESGEEYEEEEEEEEADADGEVEDYFGDAEGDQDMHDHSYDDAALEAEFMDAFNEDEPAEVVDQPTPEVGGTEAVTPATANTGTPVAQTDDSGTEAAGATGAAAVAAAEQEESGDDDDEDDDEEGDDDDMGGDGDEDRHDEVAGVRSQIASLKKQLAELEENLPKMKAAIMRTRLQLSIKNIKSEIKLKQSSIGEADDD